MVLALLKKERRVSFNEAWCLLSPNGFLSKGGISSYMSCYANSFTEIDEDNQLG
jgi:hypothetical protein